MLVKKLTLQEVELIAHDLAQRLMAWNEPIPPFKTRSAHKLESCITQPYMSFGGKELYPGFINKAAILFYLMNKNHPFLNGNKRVAMTTLFYFLSIHSFWLNVDQQRLYNFAKWVSASPPEFKDDVVRTIKKFVNTYLGPFDK